jgi:serine/threonine protein kinase
MDHDTEPSAPDIPDFDLIRPIGRGGFGEVWLATNRTTGHLRAIKVIPLQHAGASSAAAREISSLTRLEANLHCRHPNLLQIHHVGKTATHLFYVMDPADDISGNPASNDPAYQPATLQTKLQNGPTPLSLQPDVCLDYARQLLAGLASLHAAGMVHRDVKPANCLFVDGRLKLADFGLLTESHPLVSRLGTQKYMPPDGRMDTRADVYAAGLLIYELLTGQPVDSFPHLGPHAREIVRDPTLSRLLRLVLRACEREPQERFADARAMLAELDRPAKPRPRCSRRRMLIVTIAAVLAALGVGVWAITPDRVSVSFVTEPYEAKIYVDDVLLTNPADESPYTTPCTVDNLTASTHRVAFECDDQSPWDAGQFDFARTQQIVSDGPK